MEKLIVYGLWMFVVACACKKSTQLPQQVTDPTEEETKDPENPELPKLTNLGAQVTESVIQSGQFVTTEQNIALVYSVVKGTPSRLVGFDANNGRLLVNVALAGTETSWSVTLSTDGWLYVAGGDSGKVFKHKPGSVAVEDLGRALPSETYVWEVTAGKDGEIFGCTFPGARVFRYHPNDGFSDVGKGALVVGERYVRTLAYSPSNDKLYAGVGSVAANLVELDPRTGVKTEILPIVERKAGFVYPLVLVPDVAGGSRLFATVNGKTLVYNVDHSSAVEREITGISSRAYARSLSEPNKVYHSHSSTELRVYDFATSSPTSVKVGNTARALAMTWGKDNLLRILNDNNKLVKFNPVNSQSTTVDVSVPPQPINIRITALGADGRIHTSGYPGGGNGAYDPETGEVSNYTGLGQAESIIIDGAETYFNIYPGAHVYKYDSRQPWVTNTNPRRMATVTGQDRIFGAVNVPRHNSLFLGTVADYGVRGGVLARYNKTDNQITNYGEVVQDQSIISLLYKDDMIYGGTSIFGGGGTVPSQTEAKLFVWDILGNRKVREIVPVSGKRQVTNLIIGPDGYIWGVAEDTLFIYDPKTNTVKSTHKLVDRYFSASWKSIELVVHPNGKVYGAGANGGAMFSIDPSTMKITKLVDDAAWISMDKKGQLYFSRGGDLWQYIPGN